jgi:uncharacterized protein (TIGR00251 family)
VIFQIRVTPRSSRNRIEVAEDGSVKIWVMAAPTDGQANQAVCEAIAKKLGVAKSAVSVVRGDTSRSKTICVDGLEMDDVMVKLRL